MPLWQWLWLPAMRHQHHAVSRLPITLSVPCHLRILNGAVGRTGVDNKPNTRVVDRCPKCRSCKGYALLRLRSRLLCSQGVLALDVTEVAMVSRRHEAGGKRAACSL